MGDLQKLISLQPRGAWGALLLLRKILGKMAHKWHGALIVRPLGKDIDWSSYWLCFLGWIALSLWTLIHFFYMVRWNECAFTSCFSTQKDHKGLPFLQTWSPWLSLPASPSYDPVMCSIWGFPENCSEASPKHVLQASFPSCFTSPPLPQLCHQLLFKETHPLINFYSQD